MVKAISQHLTLPPAVPETIRSLLPDENKSTHFSPQTPVSFKQFAKLLLYHDDSVGIKKNKPNELYLIKNMATSRFSVWVWVLYRWTKIGPRLHITKAKTAGNTSMPTVFTYIYTPAKFKSLHAWMSTTSSFLFGYISSLACCLY